MLDDQDSELILRLFLMEAWEGVAALEEGVRLLAAGQPVSSGLLDPLVVVAHRLKDAAALHAYPVVSAVALVLEEMIEALPEASDGERPRRIEVLADVVTTVKRMLEVIGDVGREDVAAVGLLRTRHPELFYDREALTLVFLPGFSTAGEVTATSGRGVGMDVVRTNVSRLHGEIDLQSELGSGTRITIKLPLTVVISDALLVRSGGETFAVPMNAIRSIVQVRSAEVERAGDRERVMVEEEAAELVRLDRVRALPAGSPPARQPVLVLEMPRISGYELTEDLRARASTRALPVVVLTSRAGAKHVNLARRLGIAHYVTKPVDERAFVRLMVSLTARGAGLEPTEARS